MLIVVGFVGSHGVLLPENLRHVFVEYNAVVWSSGFLESLGGFIVWFWLANLGSKGFEVQPLGFKAVQSSLFLDMTQH